MYVARLLYPVEVLGPGKRIGIWFCGCPHHCAGCSNPELWDFKDEYSIDVASVIDMAMKISSKYHVDGFTISGGDPFYQKDDLAALLSGLKNISDDILVYTGYLKEEIDDRFLNDVAVLIDGKYIEARNNGCFLRGSDNQRIFILNPKHREKYNAYLLNGVNKIQNFSTAGGIVSVGIHRPGFGF